MLKWSRWRVNKKLHDFYKYTELGVFDLHRSVHATRCTVANSLIPIPMHDIGGGRRLGIRDLAAIYLAWEGELVWETFAAETDATGPEDTWFTWGKLVT